MRQSAPEQGVKTVRPMCLLAVAAVFAMGGCTSDQSLDTAPEPAAPKGSANPTPSALPPATEQEQVAACREMQGALQSVTRQRVTPWPPLSGEASAFVLDTERVMAATQHRLSATDQELVWRARSALNQIVIGDQDPSPFAVLESVRRDLAALCGR